MVKIKKGSPGVQGWPLRCAGCVPAGLRDRGHSWSSPSHAQLFFGTSSFTGREWIEHPVEPSSLVAWLKLAREPAPPPGSALLMAPTSSAPSCVWRGTNSVLAAAKRRCCCPSAAGRHPPKPLPAPYPLPTPCSEVRLGKLPRFGTLLDGFDVKTGSLGEKGCTKH